MKLNCFKLSKKYYLIILLSSCFAKNYASMPQLDPNQTKIVAIVKEFINPATNPNKKFRQYASEIIEVLKTNPVYQPVCATLQELVNKNCTNPIEFAIKFKRYEHLVPKNVADALKSIAAGKKETELIAIFRARLKA